MAKRVAKTDQIRNRTWIYIYLSYTDYCQFRRLPLHFNINGVETDGSCILKWLADYSQNKMVMIGRLKMVPQSYYIVVRKIEKVFDKNDNFRYIKLYLYKSQIVM